jgi:hypothetical protein
MKNNIQLRKIIDKHGLTSQQMADLLCVRLATVNSWRRMANTTAMPDGAFKLLKCLIKLGELK